MTKIVIALLSLAAPLACAALPSGSPSGAAAPGEEKVVQMKGVMSLSPAMVKEINEGGALTISSPSFPSGYYTVYRFVSSRGNVVQAFSVLERNQLQALGMALPVQVKAREELDEDVSWKLEREVVAMFSYGRSYMPHCEEVLVREAVYGPLSGAMVSHGGGGGFTEGLPAGETGLPPTSLNQVFRIMRPAPSRQTTRRRLFLRTGSPTEGQRRPEMRLWLIPGRKSFLWIPCLLKIRCRRLLPIPRRCVCRRL